MAQASGRREKINESLIFTTPEQGNQFTEQVGEQLRRAKQSNVKRQKEIVSEQMAEEFAKAGEPVDIIRHPWDHTPAEHAEVQELVNIAFEKDLMVALQEARKSKNFPRNIDLLHDVLTTEMYTLVTQSKTNRQSPTVMTVLLMIVFISVLVAMALLLWIFLSSL